MPRISLFIDEAGDPGVRDGLRYIGDRHEWMCVAAVVVRTSRTSDLVDWVKEMRLAAKSTQSGSLHFHKVHRSRRQAVCEVLASKPCKAFVVASHKSNLREYINPRLQQMISSGKFYNWCLRLLLERATAWVEDWQREQLGGIEPFYAQFGERGHDWEHFFHYVDKLEMQSRHHTLMLRGPGLHHKLLDRSHWKVEQAAASAGIQLADTVASAFYQAANSASPAHDLDPALALRPILPSINGVAKNAGVTVFPLPKQAPVPSSDRAIFEAFGYAYD